jgi:zinc protease
MLNRTETPAFKNIDSFSIKEYQLKKLDSGLDIYLIEDATSDVLKIDFFYNGGVRSEPANGIATAAASLLTEGTSRMSAEEIANAFDFYGAFIQASANKDESQVTIYCLPKFFKQCCLLLKDVLMDAQYPEKEINIYKKNAVQSLIVKEKKTSFLSKRRYENLLFGNNNSYGKSVSQEDIKNISRETVLGFGKSVYSAKPVYVMAAGKIPEGFVEIMNVLFRDLAETHVSNDRFEEPIETRASTDIVWVNVPGAKQCSVRIGKLTINRNHKDFRELTIVNLFLGGFFGSRLMKNIREEKGLTYGIYSDVEPKQNATSFNISVELNKDSVMVGIDEIRKELKRLRETPTTIYELDIAKNYYLGSFLRGFDGVFSLSSFAKTIIDYKLSYEYYSGYLNVIQSLTPERLQQLASEHLHEDSMITVVAGPMNE